MKNHNPSPFTYLVGWSKLNRYYYGVRYAKDADPTSLWVTYFTSSKVVRKFRTKHGEPDVIQVRRSFSNRAQAQLWEHKVLRRLGVPNNEVMLNKGCGQPSSAPFAPRDGAKNPFFGLSHSEAHKTMMRNRFTGRKYQPETVEKMRLAKLGKKASDTTKAKMSKSQTGRVHSEETKAKMRAYHELRRTIKTT